MTKSTLAFFILVFLTLIAIVVLGIMFLFKPQVAGISIQTNPISTVLIDGVEVGKTPYDFTYSPGEVHIKLIPDSFSTPLLPYETKVDLVSGVKTAIRYEFAQTQSLGSAEILSFEKGINRESGLAVISDPTDVEVSINNEIVGSTPHKINLDPADYTVKLKKEGYNEKSLSVRVVAGYKLTAWVKLAPDVAGTSDSNDSSETEDVVQEISTISPSPVQEVKPKEFVVILDTGTGFLRVRKTPSTLSEEVGKVEPKKEYEILDTDKKTGWYKIEFSENNEGWISNQYARKISNISPTTTP